MQGMDPGATAPGRRLRDGDVRADQVVRRPYRGGPGGPAGPAGRAFGYLGPGGAGKTTLIRMLLGLAAPASVSMRLEGHRGLVADRRRHCMDHPCASAAGDLQLTVIEEADVSEPVIAVRGLRKSSGAKEAGGANGTLAVARPRTGPAPRAFHLPPSRQPAHRPGTPPAKDSTCTHPFERCPPLGPARSVQIRNAPSGHRRPPLRPDQMAARRDARTAPAGVIRV